MVCVDVGPEKLTYSEKAEFFKIDSMNYMSLLPKIVHLLFLTYTVMLFLRVISSWFPREWHYHRLVHFLAFYTDPYLNIFRRILPPLGGVMDLSPILAFFALRFLEMLVLGILR